MDKKAVSKINALAGAGKPFLFIVDYSGNEAYVFAQPEVPDDVLTVMPGFSNVSPPDLKCPHFEFEAEPPHFSAYQDAFGIVQREIRQGNTFLINLTFKSRIQTNLSLRDIFAFSKARYKLLFKDCFTVFSPETFIRIRDRRISCYPMKGTIDAGIPDAENILLNDEKETAEHNTIVDLIRNDLGMVSEDVKVDRFRYIEKLQTHKGALLQMSSEISGTLPEGFEKYLGDILFSLLPAGSISGAPKPRTLAIIREAENYNRGFYSGVFGYFDGRNLDSAVMIRFIEKQNGTLFFKSGGGITAMSDVRKEYDELIHKIYVPFS